MIPYFLLTCIFYFFLRKKHIVYFVICYIGLFMFSLWERPKKSVFSNIQLSPEDIFQQFSSRRIIYVKHADSRTLFTQEEQQIRSVSLSVESSTIMEGVGLSAVRRMSPSLMLSEISLLETVKPNCSVVDAHNTRLSL